VGYAAPLSLRKVPQQCSLFSSKRYTIIRQGNNNVRKLLEKSELSRTIKSIQIFRQYFQEQLKEKGCMKKICAIALCIIIMVGLVGCAEAPASGSSGSSKPIDTNPPKESEKAQIANPWSDWKSLRDAEIAVGFEFGLPETVAGSYSADSYRTLNEEMIEITYHDGDYEVIVRKAVGEGQDCSGDYTDYSKVETDERDGGIISFYIGQHHVGKTILSHDGYSWSLVTPSGFGGDSCMDFLNAIYES
jgi:hypothetical protein